MRIIIGADLVPTQTNILAFKQGDALAIVGEKAVNWLKDADFRIYNLETPLCDEANPINKNGPHLITPTAAVKGYKALGADLLSMANNHILDQGQQGILSTFKAVDGENIARLGCGTPTDAAKPYIINDNGKKIGVYSCAEHEFSIASGDKLGANPFDPLECPDRIAKLKAECDFVIVLYHGGREFYRYPLPQLQKNCRKLVEKGADLVVCQHTHCVGCYEDYSDGKIVYGQGNFVFDRKSDEYWNTSLLIKVDTLTKEVEYLPLSKASGTLKAAEGDEAQAIIDGFLKRSEEIKDEDFVAKRLKQEAKANALYIARSLAGNSLFHKVLCKLAPSLLEKMLLKKAKRLKTLNLITCESHREIVISALED
ncbi:MAG: CapA family protein [Clostridia bacterium]|nr:CapA family protein [Clostridia bacterium]